LWLAGRGRAEGPDGSGLRIDGVIGLAPITALDDFQARSDRCGSAIVSTLLGGEDVPPDVRDHRRASTDPGRLLPLGVPQLLLVGELDGIVPVEHVRAWARRARAAGDPVEVRVVPGAGHFELVAPWTAPWSTVEATLDDFLREPYGG
jgi:pimeloyl-ACP methyl ester carboxylesterase